MCGDWVVGVYWCAGRDGRCMHLRYGPEIDGNFDFDLLVCQAVAI